MFQANRVVKLCALVLTVFCFGLSGASAYAASLGKLEVKSKLYEPFEARIALRGLKAGWTPCVSHSRATRRLSASAWSAP
jgi:hypothetical protein